MMKDNSEEVFLHVFYVEGHHKQFQHESRHPLYDNVHPALPRPSMDSTIHCPRCPERWLWERLPWHVTLCDHWLRQHRVQMINDAMHNRRNLEQLNNNKITCVQRIWYIHFMSLQLHTTKSRHNLTVEQFQQNVVISVSESVASI